MFCLCISILNSGFVQILESARKALTLCVDIVKIVKWTKKTFLQAGWSKLGQIDQATSFDASKQVIFFKIQNK